MAKGNTPSPSKAASSGGTTSGGGSAQQIQQMNTVATAYATAYQKAIANGVGASAAVHGAVLAASIAAGNTSLSENQINAAIAQGAQTAQAAQPQQQATQAPTQPQAPAQPQVAAQKSVKQKPVKKKANQAAQATQNSTPSNATSPNVKAYFGDNNGGFKDAKDLVANQDKILAFMDAATKRGGMNKSTQTPQWYAAEMMGFNAKPNVVDSMSVLPNQANRVTMYRGVDDAGGSGAARAQQFKTGDHFPGIGIYGDGSYFQLSYSGAQMYANTSNKANIITVSVDTSKLRIASVSQLKKERDKILADPKTSPRVKQLIQRNGTLTDAKGNIVTHQRRHGDGALGTLATLLGYDAIYVPGGNGGNVPKNQPTNSGKNNDFYVILNRGAVDVKAGY